MSERSDHTKKISWLAEELYRQQVGVTHARAFFRVDPKQRATYRKMARRTIHIDEHAFFPEATCVVCGCKDSRACPGGCTWVFVSRLIRKGVCSNCVKKKED